ncbi:hypothetical protein SLE2022_174560 [Rubroshorea leprosula]
MRKDVSEVIGSRTSKRLTKRSVRGKRKPPTTAGNVESREEDDRESLGRGNIGKGEVTGRENYGERKREFTGGKL